MSCADCGGSGFVVTEHGNGLSSAAPCSCRVRSIDARKTLPPPTDTELAAAVELMAGMIPFFPKGPMEQAFIALQLGTWFTAKSDLHRFTQFACTNTKEWKGLAALWESYESRLESDAAAAAMQENGRLLERYQQEFLALRAPERAELEEAKSEIVASLALMKRMA